ncbi:MAG: hypothetical protein AAF652_13595 [Cyanobacteria bacterium P01_C01_bin.72]
MASLKNFTDDEQIMIINFFNLEALINKLSSITGLSTDDITSSVSSSTVCYIDKLKDDDVRKILNHHRQCHSEAIQEAHKITQSQQN